MSGITPNKPALGMPTEPSFLTNVKTMLEILTGRRSNKIAKLYPKLLSAAASPPTQAEYNSLAQQVETLQEKVNELIARFDT